MKITGKTPEELFPSLRKEVAYALKDFFELI
jgi:hypothetical protein